jgi:ankyrin repeat protein
MSPGPAPARQLPPAFNLEQQKRRARELLAAGRAGDPEAVRRLRESHPRLGALGEAEVPGARLTLADAQLVLARECGFPSWPRLKRHLEEQVAARRTRVFVREVSYYDDRAQGLVSVHQGGLPGGLAQIREWHPRFAGASDDAIRAASFTLDDARLVYAREHGFEAWGQLVAHVEALARGAAREPFAAAFEAIRAGDRAGLETLLRRHPDLALARGTNGNTLLNLACSLLPRGPLASGDRLALVRLLLAAGADADAANNRGWTPLHQAGYGNHADLAELLLAAGAAIDRNAHGDGGTPLAAALFWGHREAAELLAAPGIVPWNLRIAAGLGRPDLVRSFFTPDGRLKPEAGARRGFYRPHSGFPVWQPADDPQQVLDEALVWACKSGRVEVIGLLAERGAGLDADPYRGTPLLWAAFCGQAEAASRLLDLGADVNRRATFGGPSHGEGVTALHLAAQNGNPALCRLLIERGADPAVEDALYRSTPAGWAAHFGHEAVCELLNPRSPTLPELPDRV